MFEGKIPIAPDSRSSAEESLADEGLCELKWGELVARLSAARELRMELAATDQMTLASFDADSARHLAWQHASTQQDGSQRVVNRDDLGNGKGSAPERAARTACGKPATRGNT